MKKYGLIILFLMGINGLFFSEKVEAADSISETELGIIFKQEDSLVDPPIIDPPILSPIENPKIVKPAGRLPSTGELITSVIWMFVGLSILIVIVGVHSLRRVMIQIA